MDTQVREPETQTFVEAALKLGGKSEEEARTTGTVDRADDQVDALFAARYQTANSPVHRVVWDREAPIELFLPQPPVTSPASEKIMQRSLEAVSRNRAQGTLYGPDGKVSEAVLKDLSEAGYWGLLIDPEFGGGGASFASFSRFLDQDGHDRAQPGRAGVGSRVHRRGRPVAYFRQLRTERTVSAQAGQRRTALGVRSHRARRRLRPDRAQDPGRARTATITSSTARSCFITNAVPGRTIGLVCLIEKRPAVLIVDLPDHENEHFQLVTYGLLALRHLHNHGLRFRDFRVPRENLLKPAQGDGLTIAYHGLNLGRVALAPRRRDRCA